MRGKEIKDTIKFLSAGAESRDVRLVVSNGIAVTFDDVVGAAIKTALPSFVASFPDVRRVADRLTPEAEYTVKVTETKLTLTSSVSHATISLVTDTPPMPPPVPKGANKQNGAGLSPLTDLAAFMGSTDMTGDLQTVAIAGGYGTSIAGQAAMRVVVGGEMNFATSIAIGRHLATIDPPFTVYEASESFMVIRSADRSLAFRAVVASPISEREMELFTVPEGRFNITDELRAGVDRFLATGADALEIGISNGLAILQAAEGGIAMKERVTVPSGFTFAGSFRMRPFTAAIAGSQSICFGTDRAWFVNDSESVKVLLAVG